MLVFLLALVVVVVVVVFVALVALVAAIDPVFVGVGAAVVIAFVFNLRELLLPLLLLLWLLHLLL